jgi:hypothetical protein
VAVEHAWEGLRFRTRLFPTALVVARTGGLCFRDRVFGNKLPLLRLVAHARGIDPQGQRANMKDAVSLSSVQNSIPTSAGSFEPSGESYGEKR